MKPKHLSVREYYKITDEDMDNLSDKACESYYWEDSHSFLAGRLGNPVSGMSDPQIAWIEKILSVIHDNKKIKKGDEDGKNTA